jgi:hypothetical protein
MKKTIDTFSRVLSTISGVLFGAIVGAIIRLFALPTTFGSVSSLLWQYAPWMGVSGIIFGLLFYRFPGFFGTILDTFLGSEIRGSQD